MVDALIKNGVVVNTCVPNANSSLESAFQAQCVASGMCDTIVQSEDDVGIGYTYNGTSFTAPTPPPPPFDPDVVMGEIYAQLTSRMIALAPYFGVAQALIQFQNWTGLVNYMAGLLQAGSVLQSDVNTMSSILLSNGIDLSQY